MCGSGPHSKLNLSLYSRYYAEACNEFAEPISASLRTGNTALFEEMLQRRWRAIGNTVIDLTGPRFDTQTFSFIDDCVTVRLTGHMASQNLTQILKLLKLDKACL